jgi:hypothetical protein
MVKLTETESIHGKPSGLRASAERPAFWLIASLIFSFNSVFSVLSDQWFVALFQAMTSAMALVAAIAIWEAKRSEAARSGLHRQ